MIRDANPAVSTSMTTASGVTIPATGAESTSVARYGTVDLVFTAERSYRGGSDPNPYDDVTLEVEIRDPDGKRTLPLAIVKYRRLRFLWVDVPLPPRHRCLSKLNFPPV